MENRGQEYAKLLEACRPPEKQSTVKTAIATVLQKSLSKLVDVKKL